MKTNSEALSTTRRIMRQLSFACRPHRALALGLLLPGYALAFPPAPDHVFYGMVRDEMGDPIMVANAKVILETATGIQLKAAIVPNMEPGVNYRLQVPMDCGLATDLYKPTALWPAVSFRIKVTIGAVTNLPIELHGNYANLGKPSETTHLDLTLGVDSDGDGLPDAWEYALIAMLGDGRSLADIRPGDDSDGDGLTNLQEYLAGTYAFDPQDGVLLNILGMKEGRTLLDFLVVVGRTYTILSSTDLKSWTPTTFRVTGDDPSAAPFHRYSATDVRILHAEAVAPETLAPGVRTFKLIVQ